MTNHVTSGILLLIFREGVKKNVFWDFVPNIGPHPPTAQVWDSTKGRGKKNRLFLGKSPKQRTPTTHRYSLGLT